MEIAQNPDFNQQTQQSFAKKSNSKQDSSKNQ